MPMPSDEPDLYLTGLSLWAIGRAFPQSEYAWDRDHIDIRARVDAPGSHVEISGACIRSNDIARFTQQLEALHRDLRGTAALEPLQPDLNVKVRVDATGHVGVTIEITPDHMTQSHSFEFEIDQTYLATTLAQCHRLLERFPVEPPDAPR
jgi:hypothetical protein